MHSECKLLVICDVIADKNMLWSLLFRFLFVLLSLCGGESDALMLTKDKLCFRHTLSFLFSPYFWGYISLSEMIIFFIFPSVLPATFSAVLLALLQTEDSLKSQLFACAVGGPVYRGWVMRSVQQLFYPLSNPASLENFYLLTNFTTICFILSGFSFWVRTNSDFVSAHFCFYIISSI